MSVSTCIFPIKFIVGLCVVWLQKVDETEGNVHSGAQPPWLETTMDVQSAAVIGPTADDFQTHCMSLFVLPVFFVGCRKCTESGFSALLKSVNLTAASSMTWKSLKMNQVLEKSFNLLLMVLEVGNKQAPWCQLPTVCLIWPSPYFLGWFCGSAVNVGLWPASFCCPALNQLGQLRLSSGWGL